MFLRKRNQVFSEKKFPELERCARDLIDSYYPWRNYQSIRFAGRAVSMESIFILESVFNRWLVSYIETMKALGATLAPVEFMDVRVSQAIYLIQQFPLRNKFGEKELAQRIGLSVNQLCRLFKKHLGVTPYGYYEKHRLQVARDVIETTSMPMKEIAYELGFASTSNFSNWYRERVGQSPRAARKSGSVVV
ncbi:MAG: helix-turn-helix domain-containing protein [Puniceicoccales bacterium]